MKNEEITREQLLAELAEMRQRVAELEASKTSRERAEEQFREQSEFLENIIESLAHPFYVVDVNDYTIKIANSAALAQTDALMEHLTCYALAHKSSEPCEGLEHTCPLEEVKKTKRPVTVEHIHYDKDGNAKVVEVHGHPVFDSDGNVIQMIEYCIDITKRKRAEEKLEQAHIELKDAYDTLKRAQDTAVASEKMAALGRLSAGISHEVLNPLNVITMSTHMLLDTPNIPEDIAEDLRLMQEQANRIIKISQGLLYFARQRVPERKETDLNEIINKTLSLLEHELRLGNIAVELRLAEDLPKITADQDQLQQVVLNLLTNARDAMTAGGRLVISTAEAEPLFSTDGKLLELRVEDTGPGIPPENMDKLFDPFFTTKPEGEGTGLGLSICKGIIEAHGGTIWAENVEGRGTTFIIQLPLEQIEESNA